MLASCGDDDIVLRRYKNTDMFVVDQEYVDRRQAGVPNIIIEKNVDNLPVVAVLLGLDKDLGGAPKYYVYESYVDSFRAAGLYPMFVPYANGGKWLEKINPAAILTVGGGFGDFYKATVRWYNYGSDYADMRRAHAYQVAIDYAKNYGIPYLGICAGAQELGMFLGGALETEINFGAPKVFHNNGSIHVVKIRENTTLHKIIGKKEIDANSFHNAAVHPGRGDFNVLATSLDGRVEAIEPKKPWNEFVLGVQWHPEKNAGDCADENPDCKLFKSFADAARKYAESGGRQQIRVVVPNVNDSRARVGLYHNARLVKAFDGFVGASGATSQKAEGDMKTPLGTFEIKRAFGAADVDTKVSYRVVKDGDIWCDDSNSKLYNTLQKRGVKGCKSFEDMGGYKYGIVIEYNTKNPKPWAGSAIFLHDGDKPTAGCVAVSEDAVREILEWLDPARMPEMKIIAPGDDGFYISHIPAKMLKEMRDTSLPPGAPIKPDELRLIRIRHWGFDNAVHSGELIVHKEIARDIADIFRELFWKKYPIEQMQILKKGDPEYYNNGGAFWWRKATNKPTLSYHAVGLAVDINPKYNPYVNGDLIVPSYGKEFLDRSLDIPGIIKDGDDAAVVAFKKRGFDWGGDWVSTRGYADYMHFEKRIPEIYDAYQMPCEKKE